MVFIKGDNVKKNEEKKIDKKPQALESQKEKSAPVCPYHRIYYHLARQIILHVPDGESLSSGTSTSWITSQGETKDNPGASPDLTHQVNTTEHHGRDRKASDREKEEQSPK